jgi:hypothetical protein
MNFRKLYDEQAKNHILLSFNKLRNLGLGELRAKVTDVNFILN